MSCLLIGQSDRTQKIFLAERDLSSTELESGNALERFLQAPAPALDQISGPMGAQFVSCTGLGLGTLIGNPPNTSTG